MIELASRQHRQAAGHIDAATARAGDADVARPRRSRHHGVEEAESAQRFMRIGDQSVATDLVTREGLLVDEHDIEPGARRNDGRGAPGRTCAHHEHIAVRRHIGKRAVERGGGDGRRRGGHLKHTDNRGMTHTASFAALWRPVAAMAIVVTLSNVLVQYPINDWLTWGAFSYPLVFLVTDLTNRAVGGSAARKVAVVGFAVAVIASLALGPWRIALASGSAFLLSQILDISVFNRLRAQTWWKAPLIGSMVASVIDTVVFFFIAFAGTDLDWTMLAAGDLGVKWLMALLLLAPYRAMLPRLGLWVPVR